MSTFATTISKTKNSLSILLITTSIVLFVGYKSYTASQQSLTLTRELAGLLRNKQYVVAGKFIREHLDDGLKK
jgi:hypothetical protein